MTDLKLLQPGGAALSPVLLQRLVELGVNVKTTYGSTEIGPPYRTIPDTIAGSCYKVRCLLPNDPHIKMEPQGDNLYECVVYKGFTLAAELWLNPEAPNPYRTNDLFIQDPPNSGLYVLQGRKDDILVHSNGEKTNALPLQMAIEESHSDIHKVVVFGTDKPCTSAVLELNKNSQADFDSIFKAVEKACDSFPSFSRLDRSLILVLSDGETLPVTPKGNVRRNEAQKLYGQRVEILYAENYNGSAEEHEDNEKTGLDDLDFVRSSVAAVCETLIDNIHSDSSFYTLGLDSQKAVRLRSRLTKQFGTFPLMFIFEYPTSEALLEHITAPKDISRGISTREKNAAWIKDAISRYNAEIKSWSAQASPLPAADRSSGEVIYLTGATGALGNALLSAFATDPKVSTVYCAIRGPSAAARLSQSLLSRGYSTSISTCEKFIAVPYDMQSSTLGLDTSTYETLARTVTSVVHNAWKMDFNHQVDRFEPDCLRGTLHLMRFACTSVKKAFAFTSSVATNMGPAAVGTPVTETPIVNGDDVELALETGYAQSKFIVEVVAQTFSRELGMEVRMFRVGQLCGHSVYGSWNASEMFPIMMVTGLRYLKAMPTEGQTVNWLPVDVCAEAVRAVLVNHHGDRGLEEYSLHNLVNPGTVSWGGFLDRLKEASGVAFERVSMKEWVSRLEKISEREEGVPGAKLLGFFETMAQAEQGEAVFDNAKTAALVPGLKKCKSVDTGLLRLYLQRWKEIGFA